MHRLMLKHSVCHNGHEAIRQSYLSDQALMHFPSFKLGPGESSRSHSADEFIRISEIRDAIAKYETLLDGADLLY